MAEDFAARVTDVAALADPVRRALYEQVVAAGGPVSREQAAGLADVPVHTARFHLDRLVDAGLLEVEHRRLSGRTGPGAGRPAKLYRRADREVAVSVPPRSYDFAGALLAAAVEESGALGRPAVEVLADVARRRGLALALASDAAPPAPQAGPRPAPDDVAQPAPDDVARRATAVLTAHGYAPRVVGDEIHLANCPFHALVTDHAALVCGMNLALLDGVAQALGPAQLRPRLAPAEGRCCVVLDVERARPGGTPGTGAASDVSPSTRS